MRSQQELYQEAMRSISSRRQTARTRASELQTALEAAIPALADATEALRQAGIHAALTAARGQNSAQAKQAIFTAKQARDAVLIADGRAPDCLEPKFTCAICQDTGTYEGKPCQCVRKLMRAIRRSEIEASSSLSISQFNSMKLHYYPDEQDAFMACNTRAYMQQLLEELQEYAEDFNHSSPNLLLFGNSGLGKTHAALSIAGIVLEKSYDVIYLSSPEFFSKLELYHFNNSPAEESALLDAVTNADLLILDDLGTELVSSFTISTLYTLLNNRMSAHTPTIFTSNITDSVLFEKRYTEKISSRIMGICEPCRFLGNDIRALKAMEP